MQTFIARQPIFDLSGECVAYELLYRKNKKAVHANVTDNAEATARVLINFMHNIGFDSFTDNKTGYINIDETILLNDILLSLPKEKFVFEVLETIPITPEVVEKIGYYYHLGYRFSLDDFSCNPQNLEYFKPIFPFMEIVKIDLLLMHEYSIEEMAEHFSPYKLQLLAEKVEDFSVFERCKKSGFKLFQGYFFEKPTIITGKKIELLTASVIDIINTLHINPDINVITDKFSLYPDLTFSLLQYINSAEYSFRSHITSIRQIINLLGPQRLRSWLGLFLYSSNNKRIFGDTIVKSAKFRANMMRELVIALKKNQFADEAFLTGSLSLIDTYLQVSMEEMLGKIILGKSITDALLHREGYLGKLLSLVEKMETNENLEHLLDAIGIKLGLTSEEIYRLFCKANNFKIDS
ncbi:EAL domain-containing protein [Sulfuricurvum sp.]|uniref:EAL and HDOD domain-containing protein n=1 Tax=Sulfuricurvum sp. TaxID=2025608 RepID=UPI002621A0DF|nr:EAL domain-containing protein [Sulfuricurvum sp.]MDD4949674.1 EAL domain-containing protein [Sulfuricurvum sp.]